jgi:hypothetical protein
MRLPEQDEEGDLEGVIGVFRIGQHLPADSKHHRTVPLDQGGESQLGRLTVTRRKSLQDLSVSQIPNAPQVEKGAHVSVNGAVLCRRHTSSLRLRAIRET